MVVVLQQLYSHFLHLKNQWGLHIDLAKPKSRAPDYNKIVQYL